VTVGGLPRGAYLAASWSLPTVNRIRSTTVRYQGRLCMPESVVGFGMTMTPDSLALCIGPVAGIGCVQILADWLDNFGAVAIGPVAVITESRKCV
jgi:hypothetical protein